MLYKFFDKKAVLGASVNRQLAEELHKPVIKKCKKKGKSMPNFGRRRKLLVLDCLKNA